MTWHRAGYTRRVNDRRCVKCGKKLPATCQYKTCDPWRAETRVYASVWRREKTAESTEPIAAPANREPGCKRCGLRGHHECLVGHADDRKAR